MAIQALSADAAVKRVEHRVLAAWIAEVAALTEPDDIYIVDGSDDEWKSITDQLVAHGTFVPLKKKPNSFWCASDPDDVARVEDRTYICSVDEADAGPTNNWVAPDEMKSTMRALYRGSMRGRTMYVIPFCMGSLEAKNPMFGVEITDSAYVVASMRIMTRIGKKVLDRMGSDA
ncbi:MAG: phosphoenolpyruvate carboxykinase, partial [Actinomycetota bacterium]